MNDKILNNNKDANVQKGTINHIHLNNSLNKNLNNNLNKNSNNISGKTKMISDKTAFIDTNAALRKDSTLNGSAATQALSYHEYLSLKEPIEHGSIDFPLKVYEISTLTWLKERIWCHWHDEIEFVVVTRGGAHFQINDSNYDVSENDIIIVPPNSLHFATQDVGKPFDFIAVVFSLDFISQVHDDVIYQKYVTPILNHQVNFPKYIHQNHICMPAPTTSNLTVSDWYNCKNGKYKNDGTTDSMCKNTILNILYKIRSLYHEKSLYYELDIKTQIFQLWHELLVLAGNHSKISDQTSAKSSKSLAKTTQIKAILAYLKSHYSDTLSLKDIAEYFHLSEGHLCRMFKDVTGKTLTDYLNYYRITMSTSLLLKTDTDIAQIALSVGFNNVSYFNKIFKKYMNKTPKEFRKTEGNY